MRKPNATPPCPAEPRGLQCPECGCAHLPVHYTRKRNSHIQRVRLCRNCGRRIVTRERLGDAEFH